MRNYLSKLCESDSRINVPIKIGNISIIRLPDKYYQNVDGNTLSKRKIISITLPQKQQAFFPTHFPSASVHHFQEIVLLQKLLFYAYLFHKKKSLRAKF